MAKSIMKRGSNPFTHVSFLGPSGAIRPKLSFVTFAKLHIMDKNRSDGISQLRQGGFFCEEGKILMAVKSQIISFHT